MGLLLRCLLIFVASISVCLAEGPLLPDVVTNAEAGLKLQGQARLRMFGFHIYDASLWVSGDRHQPDELFALDIRYARNFKGEALAKRSVEEWQRMGVGDAEKHQRWLAEMIKVFPDVQPGDKLVGVSVPGKGARFYSDSKFLGMVEDWEFARAFFAIWLDPRTSEPSMREKLLGAR
jgi:Chalcone isomerase-like